MYRLNSFRSHLLALLALIFTENKIQGPDHPDLTRVTYFLTLTLPPRTPNDTGCFVRVGPTCS